MLADYYNTNISPVEEATNIDAGITNFFSKCAVAPEGRGSNQCAWTTPSNSDRTAQTLLAKFADWVGADPSAANRGRATTLGQAQTLDFNQSFVVRSLIFLALRTPRNFPRAAQILQSWYEDKTLIPATTVKAIGDVKLPGETKFRPRQNAGTFDPTQSTAQVNAAPNALYGITCVDSRYHPDGLSAATYQSIYNEYNAVTKYGSDLIIATVYGCM